MDVEVTCLVCKKTVIVKHWRAKTFKTCSKECMGIYFRGEINTKCAFCGKEFHLKPYARKKAQNNFCSVACLASWRTVNVRGANNPNFRKKKFDGDGYKLTYSTTYGTIPEHKAVFLDITGLDSIPKGFNIHHKDCCWYNNLPTNLVLLSASDHRWLHKEFGSATLNAIEHNKIDINTVCNWCTQPERALSLLQLNLVIQSVSLKKSGELLGTPGVDNQQPSISKDIELDMMVQRLDSEESTNNLSTSTRLALLNKLDDIVRTAKIT